MANVTYLLGAGASANALPVITEISGRLAIFRNTIHNHVRTDFVPADRKRVTDTAVTLMNSIIDLERRISKHLTVDTYARKLYAQSSSHDDLEELKRILICYFIFEQLPIYNEIRKAEEKHTPDKRYDNLIAALINDEIDSLELKQNVNVLTWNYDLQFELAFKLFCGFKTLKQTQEKLQAIPGQWFDGSEKVDSTRFSLVHLNGVAGYGNLTQTLKSSYAILDKYLNTPYKDVLDDVIMLYDLLKNPKNYPQMDTDDTLFLNFSWESKNNNPRFCNSQSIRSIDVAKKIAADTEVLVVIGYSFPAFNRWLDSTLINSMRQLRKVYIQDKNAENIQTILSNAFELFQRPANMSNRKKAFHITNNVDQFVLPYEV